MELKEWKKYSNSEKSELLTHWWFYYGKLIMTEEENQTFTLMAKQFPDAVMQFASAAYLSGYSSQPLLLMMREDKGKVYNSMESIQMAFDHRDTLVEVDKEFLSTIVESFNHPEPSIPMSSKSIEAQLRKMGVNPEKVYYIQK